MLKRTNYKGFTIIELLVTIGILILLITIGFITIYNYKKDSRNTVRITDISIIETALKINKVEVGQYPDPSSLRTITYEGVPVWKQGVVGDSVVRAVKNLNKVPIDPLFYNFYSYSTDITNQYMELGTIEE